MIPGRVFWAQITKQEKMCLGAKGMSEKVNVEEAETRLRIQLKIKLMGIAWQSSG